MDITAFLGQLATDHWPLFTLEHFREPTAAWTHLIWMVLAIPATVFLWHQSRGDRPKQWSLLVFGLGAIACFGSSAVYHAVNVPPDELRPFVMADHVGIYLLIAASCTGMAFSLLQRRWRNTILICVWLAAGAGIAGRLALESMPRLLNPMIYLVMGWALASCHPQLVRAVGERPVRLVWLGGLFYTLGAGFFIARWPVGWPGYFGSHELLHICDMAGNLIHFLFIWWYVVPFDRVGHLRNVKGALTLPTGEVPAGIGNQTTPAPV
jgi:hemolysin III